MCHKTRYYSKNSTKILKFFHLLRFESNKEKRKRKKKKKKRKRKEKRGKERKKRRKRKREGERIRKLKGVQNSGLVAKQVEQSRGGAEAEAEPA